MGIRLNRWTTTLAALAFIYYSGIIDIPSPPIYGRGPSLTELCIVALALLVFLRRIGAGKMPSLTANSTPLAFIALYLAATCASALWSPDRTQALSHAAYLIRNVALVLVIVDLCDTPHRQQVALWAFLAAGTLLAGVTLVQAATHTYTNSYLGLAQSEVRFITGSEDAFRAGGPVGDANFYALMLGALLPIAVCGVRRGANGAARVAAGLSGTLLLAAIVLTYSRGILVALAGVTAVWLILLRRRRFAFLAIGVVVVAVAIFAPRDFLERIVASTLDESSTQKRLASQEIALRMFTDHPIFGMGTESYPDVYQDYAEVLDLTAAPDHIHNTYLAIAAETGLAGLLPFCAVLFLIVRRAIRRRADASAERAVEIEDLASVCLLALVVYLIGIAFLPLSHPRYLWLLAGLTLAVGTQERRRIESHPVDHARAIAYIVSRFPKLSETFVLQEMEELVARGWQVRVLPFLRTREPVMHAAVLPWLAQLPAAHSWADVVGSHGFWLQRCPRRLWALYGLVLRRLWRRPRELVRALAAVALATVWARRVRDDRIAHVHAHFARHSVVAAMAIAELAGVSFSFTCHGSDAYIDSPLLPDKVRRSAFVICVSRLLRERHLSPRIGAHELTKVHVVRCGVHLQRFPRRDRPSNTPSARLRILSVARLMPSKGLEYLVAACAILREQGYVFECRIIGDGPLRDSLWTQIIALGLREVVHLDGPRADTDVQAALDYADVFVLPSIRLPSGETEGVPVSLMEAMASGVPVVATDTGAVSELVEQGHTGLLVQPADAVALADAIVLLARDADVRRRLAMEARQQVERYFDRAVNVGRLEELFEAAIHGSAAVKAPAGA